jgi:prophage tail gpP-like protein
MADPPLKRIIITKDDERPAPQQNPFLGTAGANREIATVVTDGEKFTNWKSFRVENRITETHPVFQFDFSEESPVPASWYLAKLKPGAKVQVFLGDYLAITGTALERHVAFDANSHMVRLVGAGLTYDMIKSTPPLNKMGAHDGKNVQQLADSLMGHLGIKSKIVGNPDLSPFKNIQVTPGETIMTTIERYARARRIVLGSDEKGNLLLIGEHEAGLSTVEHLTEGKNILRANAVVKDNELKRYMFAVSQDTGDDEKNGDKTNKQVAQTTGTSKRELHWVINAELADNPQGLQQRIEMEKLFTQGSEIEAHITVQGWFREDGHPWRAGEYYWVESPSLMLNRVLGCRGAVYEQADGAGSTTTLEMVKPQHMNGREAEAYSLANPDSNAPATFAERFPK